MAAARCISRLGDGEASLSANASMLYAMGFRSAVKRSTLAEANESRDGLTTARRPPRGSRPVVGARLGRKYCGVFSAVSPHDGVMGGLVPPWVNAETMSLFLAEVAARHAGEFILRIRVIDQAGKRAGVQAYRWGVGRAREHASDAPAALQP